MKTMKIAVAAVLPMALYARNDNDGTDQANAVTTELIDNDNYTLTLHTYNLESNGIMELHGDVEFKIKSDSDADEFSDPSGERQLSYQEYGWCIKANSDLWDCMSIQTNLLPDKIANLVNYNEEFNLIDGFYRPSVFS